MVVQLRASSLRAEEAAPVQRAFVSGRFAHRFVELELVDRGQIVAGIRHVGRDVVLGARIKLRLGARDGWRNALVLFAQSPPCFVVVLRFDLAREHLPAPFVDQKAEGQEGHLIKSRSELYWNVGLGRRDACR